MSSIRIFLIKNKLFPLLLFLTIQFVFYSCKTRNCNNIPDVFHSYEEAMKTIKNKSFELVDSVIVNNGSLIVSAKFYSCDRKTGYFFRTHYNGSEFFVSKVPISLWEEFKKSENKEFFYNDKINENFTSVEIGVELNPK